MTSIRTDLDGYALVVVDVQRGFDDEWWGRANNPDCDRNIAALAAHWGERRRPVVMVRHASQDPDSPLHPDSPATP
jgi:nicotinamidase-related amidase